MSRPLKPLLDSRQAAEVLGLHPVTVARMAKAGRIPSYRVAGRIKFHPDDITSWLEARRSPTCHES